VTAAGRISAATAPALVEAVTRALAAGERRVVVDLAGVDYISSAGLRALDALARQASLQGAAVVVRGSEGAVRVAFELAGLERDLQ
jgi:anti-anti-sigma factor